LLHRANWSYLSPRRRSAAAELDERLRRYVSAAEPGSLAELLARTPAAAGVDGPGQLPQWLFAYDPAGMAAYRALALLLAHPDQAQRAAAEIDGLDLDRPHDLPVLRAAVLESVRLWPTTAVVLRDTTTPTEWDGATLPTGAAVGVVSAFFHRDDATVDGAHRFTPDRWLGGAHAGGLDDALIPFSAGPAVCPGRELVLLTTSLFLATLLQDGDLAPDRAAPDPDRPMPAALDAFALTFRPTGGPGGRPGLTPGCAGTTGP
jgi:hypothetical protein